MFNRILKLLYGFGFMCLPLFVHATMLEMNEDCTYHTATAFNEPGSYTFGKFNGLWRLCIRQDVEPFKGKDIVECSQNPNRGWSTNSSGPDDPNSCWEGCTIGQRNICDVPVGPSYDASGALIAPGYCAADHDEWNITRCSQPGGRYTHKVEGAPFRSGHPLHPINSACTPSSPLTPNSGLIVWKNESKTYNYDAVPPVCIRGGFNATYTYFGGKFIRDDELVLKVNELNASSSDITLTYTGTIFTSNPRPYRGEWTNYNVRAMGVCMDEHSGCPEGTPPAVSEFLRHKQSTFAYPYQDVALNPIESSCSSTAARIDQISRMCTYKIESEIIEDVIDNNPEWFSSLSLDDKNFLERVKTSPPPGRDPSFAPTIKRLRDLSLNSLSSSMAIVPKHNLLYYFYEDSCRYTPIYDTYNNVIIPLIDKIKPTIKVQAMIGNGVEVFETLLEQEGTTTAGVPHIYNQESYLAGSGTIRIALTDASSSSFTQMSDWMTYNGISGISRYMATICRIKTHTGLVLNNNCTSSPSHTLLSVADTIPDYNLTGALNVPHEIILEFNLPDSVNDGVQTIGEYQVYVAMIDNAGNVNTGVAHFEIVPFGFDPSKTTLEKYNDPVIESNTSILYTITGSIQNPLTANTIESYANAIDIQSYKVSIFDIYSNPIHNWNILNLGLTGTGIYLDGVEKTGSSAIFLSTPINEFANIPIQGKTDENGGLKIHVVSYSPGEFSEQFQFSYKNWDRYRREIGPDVAYTFPDRAQVYTGTFYHIFTGAMNLYTTDQIDLGTENDIKLDFITTSSINNSSLRGFTIDNFLESVQSMNTENFTITRTGSSYDKQYSFSSYYPFPQFLSGSRSTFLPEQKGTIFDEKLKIISYPYLTVSFSGYTTRYYLSDSIDTFGSGIIYNTGSLNRIYIEGGASTTGKNGYVESKDNVLMNSANMRNAIHKNTALLLRNREADGSIVNRVKYLKGDVESTSLSDLSLWDVLVIEGGNFIIGDQYSDPGDLVTKPLRNREYEFNPGSNFQNVPHRGIIVLQDLEGNGGNIYIKPDVRFIGASLFADESVISVDYNSAIFPKSNSARTFLLDKQLTIFGGVFSKNTVGGAVRATSNGQYVLPWKNSTTSLDEAVRYDLAFLRMNNRGYETNDLNRGHGEYVVILIDSRNINNPLPGFQIE